MKIVSHKIPTKLQNDSAAMKLIVIWANDTSAPAEAEFNGVKLTKTRKGGSVYLEVSSPAGAAPEPKAAEQPAAPVTHAPAPVPDPDPAARAMRSPQRQRPEPSSE